MKAAYPRASRHIQRQQDIMSEVSYFSFLSLLLIIPLAFTGYVDNLFDLVKITLLKIITASFIISAIISSYKKDRKSNFSSPYLMPYFSSLIDPYILFFLFAAFLSTVFSINSFVSYNGSYLRQMGFITYFYVGLIYFFSYPILKDGKKFCSSIMLMEICGIIIAIYCILQFTGLDFFHLQPEKDIRPVATFGFGVYTAGFLIMIFPFSFIRIFKYKILRFGSLIPVLLIAAVILTQTRTAYVALLIQIIAILILYPLSLSKSSERFNKLFRIYLPVILLLFIALIVVILVARENIFIKRLLGIFTLTDNPRWLLWRDSFVLFGKYPITGTGLETFSIAFEDIYSMQFKIMDMHSFYDNPHNNFINILCMMGVIGLSAYIILIYRVLHLSFKGLFSKISDINQKYFYLAFIPVIFGYIVYGLADFDGISIILYLFVFMAMLKAVYVKDLNNSNSVTPQILKQRVSKVLLFIFSGLFSLYLIYNAYNAIVIFKADYYFKKANNYYASGNLNDSFLNINDALKLNPESPQYRFRKAYVLFSSAIMDTILQRKQSLLEQAENEIRTAEKNYPSKKMCREVLSLLYYEMGKNEEADRIRDELLSRDSLSIYFRTNLARQYLRLEQYSQAKQQIEFLDKYDPENVEALLTAVSYYSKIGDFIKARKLCERILELEPNNQTAKSFLKQLKQ